MAENFLFTPVFSDVKFADFKKQKSDKNRLTYLSFGAILGV